MSNFTREEQNNANALIGPTLVMSLISRLASKGILDYKDVEAIGDGTTGKSDEWASIAKRHLKSEMVKTDVRFAELAKRLTDMGLPETEASVQLKINRGTFPAWFFFAVMKALGAHVLRLHEAD
jgi:hypothetical protein